MEQEWKEEVDYLWVLSQPSMLSQVNQLQEDDSWLELEGTQSQGKLNFADSGKRVPRPEPCSLAGTAAAAREEGGMYFGMVCMFLYPLSTALALAKWAAKL